MDFVGTSVRSRTLGPEMKEVFGPGGALERALPEYEPRPEQAALAGAVEHALATGEHLVAEAGTGVGKSLAYLLPALESGQRVVVATATKALQEQLLHQDVPIAARALGRELTVAVLKGRQNYVCRRQLQGFQPFLMAEGRDARAWEAMQGWLDETETGDRAELELEPSEALWAELAVGGDRCAGRRCPFVSACFAEAARDRGRRGRHRDREPRALFRARRLGRRRAARARRRHLRRGTPARGIRRVMARRPGLARRACGGWRSTSSAPAVTRRSRCRTAARPGRALERAAAARGRAGGRPEAVAGSACRACARAGRRAR